MTRSQLLWVIPFLTFVLNLLLGMRWFRSVRRGRQLTLTPRSLAEAPRQNSDLDRTPLFRRRARPRT